MPTKLIVFGDSLSDMGNFYAAYGIPLSPPYYLGRYSNGPLWVEYLAATRGIPIDQNFAIVGAGTGHDNSVLPGAPGLLDEISNYLTSLPGGWESDPAALFVLWIGPNDFELAQGDVEYLISNGMANISTAIHALSLSGAETILVANVPDLSKTPRVRALNDPQLSQIARSATIIFNTNLAWTLGNLEDELGVDVVLFDVFSLFESVTDNPDSYGFSDAVMPCLPPGATTACAVPAESLFWDDVHPTTAAHSLIANHAHAALLSGGVSLRPTTPMLFRRGDCNGDSNFNIADAIAGLAAFFGGAGLDSLPCVKACDSNDDGGVNIADIIYMLGTLFSSGPNPPAPYFDCGLDPTPDQLDCATPSCVPSISIETPHGTFVDPSAPQISITGNANGVDAADSRVFVNGQEAVLSSDGSFVVVLGLDSGSVKNPVLAELRVNDQTVARARIVVFAGPAIASGETVADGAQACLNTGGIEAIRDELAYQLSAAGVINLDDYLPNPLGFFSDPGTVCEPSAIVTPTAAGFACHTIEVTPHSGYVTIRFSLHDVFVNLHAHGWLETCPDPGFDCDATIAAARVSVHTNVSLQPSAGGAAGEFDVTQLTPLQFDLVSFGFFLGGCDPISGFLIDIIDPDLYGIVQSAVQGALSDFLTELDSGDVLANSLEQALAAISISEPLSTALGVDVQGDASAVVLQENQISVPFDASISSPTPAFPLTYAPPLGPLEHNALDPIYGEDFDFALSVSLSILNQILLAFSSQIVSEVELTQLDMGSGAVPLTAGALALFIPALADRDPAQPFVLRVRQTLPPMLLGHASGCGISDVYFGNVLVELSSIASGGLERLEVALAVDLRGCVTLGYDAASSSLSAVVSFGSVGPEDATLLENGARADEGAITALVGALLGSFSSAIGGSLASFPIPELDGIELELSEVTAQAGYVTLYLNTIPQHGRSDLVIDEIQAPDFIDVLFGFELEFWLTNRGTESMSSDIFIGASLSPDSLYLNGNDVGLVQYLYNFSSKPLNPGESRRLTMWINPMPWAAWQEQTLFVTADIPVFIGGTGVVCESNESNNHLGETVVTTVADAYVTAVVSPGGLIGGGSPGEYIVVVGRSDVGIDFMDVPVRVVVGNPPLTSWEVMVLVPRGQEVETSIYVPTPFAFGDCGATNYFPVTACANLMVDSQPSNNCASSSVSVAVPFWDLHYEVLSSPSTTCACGTLDWNVRVTNDGNVTSPPICSMTAIGLNASSWAESLPQVFFTVPSLDPGESWTFYVHDYFVGVGGGCGIVAIGPQYVKAGIGFGCFDACLGGNADAVPIQVQCPDVAVAGVDLPGGLISGIGPETYLVHLINPGCATSVTVNVNVGPNFGTVTIPVPGGSTTTAYVDVPTPTVPFTCGGAFSQTVSVNCFAAADCNPGNNSWNGSVSVASAYWDLRFVVNGPSSIDFCPPSFVPWTVTVTNAGNVGSPILANGGRTALSLSAIDYFVWSGDFAFGSFNSFNLVALAPGESTVYSFGFSTNCGMSAGTQYFKAGINSAAGVVDACIAGNFDTDSVQCNP